MQISDANYSIRDLAKECGVSVATVSKALNNYPDVNSQTKRHILEVANAHGYFPNAAARTLKKNDNKNVVLLVNDPFHPSVNIAIRMYTEILRQKNYSLVVRYINAEDPIKAALRAIKESKASGIVFQGGTLSGREKEVERLALPVISLEMNTKFESVKNVSSFYIDNIQESYRLTEYLIEKKDGRVVLLTTETEGNSVGGQRTEGYKRALRAHQLPVRKEWIVPVRDSYYESGYAAVMNLTYTDKASFSSLLCISDRLAMGACRALFENGCAVPGDVLVAGIDGNTLTNYTIPSLTTMLQPSEEIIADSARHLLARITEGVPCCSRCYECRLIENESTNCLKPPKQAGEYAKE